MKQLLLLSTLLLLFITGVYATHNRAGEITYTRLSGFTYEVTVLTYTVEASQADDNEITLDWGDGDVDTLPRVNGPISGGFPNGEPIGNGTKMNLYKGVHTYPGPGQYVMFFEDQNRNDNVANIPGSVQQAFAVKTMVTINPFAGPNSSPFLLHPPLDNACVGELFVHNPAAYDEDGDSLAYKIIECSGLGGVPIDGYWIPAEVSVNEFTGDLIWDTPTQIGEYNYAIMIEEWRDGQMIGYVVRDLQVYVDDCSNEPPVIEALAEVCVTAGELLEIPVLTTDPNVNDVITLTSYGGVYELNDSPATFEDVTGYGPLESQFNWQTNCSHVQNQPYNVLFKAKDNGFPVELASMHTLNIQVVAPPVENVVLQPIGSDINIEWDPSICSNAIGYKVYRGSYFNFIPDECELGVPAYTGYEYVGSVEGHENTSYTDSNNGEGLTYGIEYCYMIVACFADGAESYASLEVCTTLNRDMPIITNVSIEETDVSEGKAYIAWSKPTELDFTQTPGPFRYELFRSTSGGPATSIYNTTSLDDTTFVDSLINTVDEYFTYYISFYNETPGNDFKIGDSQSANSMYLSFVETDHTLILNWTDQTPWSNNYYKIYREIPDNSGSFVYLDSSLTNTFTIDTLVNGVTSCYLIESVGAYFTSGLINPIINFSQENCGTPVDTTAPCPPSVFIHSDCIERFNIVTWTGQNEACDGDVVLYNLYFKPTLEEEYTFVNQYTIFDDSTTSFMDLTSVAGCYYVTAIDSFGNESSIPAIPEYCVDNCPEYQLPNVFTPNGDGINDYFGPYPYRFVDHVETRIYNRWGDLVHEELEDPEIKWDGRDMQSGKGCSSGVYYYVADVYFVTLNGLEKVTLKSFVHLIEFDNSNDTF